MRTIFEEGGAVLKKTWLPIPPDLLKELDSFDYEFEFGRDTKWLGDKGINYRYTNKNHVAPGWTDLTLELTKRVRNYITTDYPNIFNHLLVNRYKESHSLNSHKDNEPELAGPIASLSFGATADFNFNNGGPRRYTIQLNHGDLLIGSKKFFNDYYHGVSKPHKHGGKRFNLTWRTVV